MNHYKHLLHLSSNFRYMKKKYLFLLLILQIAAAQNNKIDSLYHIIKTTKNDSIKVDTYNKLAWKYIFNDKEKALTILNETEKQALKTKQKFGYNTFLNNKGIFFDVNGSYDSAKIYFEKSVQFSIKNKFPVQEQNSYNNLGMFAWNKGNYQEALAYFFKALALAEINQKKDPNLKIDAPLNNIGLIYQEMELYEKAIPYHQKALKIRSARKYSQGEAASYNNLGICFKNLNQIKEAKNYFEKGLLKAKQSEDKTLYYENIQGLAQILALEKNHKKALSLFLESHNRPVAIPYNSNSKVKTTSAIASLYLTLNDSKKAIEFGEIALNEINKDTTNGVYEVAVYNTLSNAHFATGNTTKGRYFNDLFFKKTTEKFKTEHAKAIQELETKYETEQKEIALQKAKVQNLAHQLDLKKRTIFLISALGLAFILGLLGFLVYKQQRLKNKQLVKENELKQALILIENQNNLQEQRLSISKDLHDNIGAQLTFIISSLDNLKYFDFTQDKLYAKFDAIGTFTRATITDLRDTIWAMNKEVITIEDLKTRTTNFIEAAKTSLLGINFEFNYPKNTAHNNLNTIQGIEVYRIIQEAVNNAIKHAEATQISVDFEITDKLVTVSIADNGKGFDPKTKEAGNGLNSIKKRAQAIPAELFITQLNPGTKVSVSFEIE